MKSSAQRQIRAKCLEQLPFLNHPAAQPAPAPAAPTVAAAPPQAHDGSDGERDDDAASGKRKKGPGAGKDKKAGKGPGGGKKGGGGGKKNRNAADQQDDDEAPAAAAPPHEGEADAGNAGGDADESLTVLDLIWPKKETLSLVKWSVLPPPCAPSPEQSPGANLCPRWQPGSHLDLHRARRTHLFPAL